MISDIYAVAILLITVKLLAGLLAVCFLVYFAIHIVSEKKILMKYFIWFTVFFFVFAAFPRKHEIITYLILTNLDKYIQEHDVDVMNPDALTLSSIAVEKSISSLEKESKALLGGRR